jgi:hypothetical protein
MQPYVMADNRAFTATFQCYVETRAGGVLCLPALGVTDEQAICLLVHFAVLNRKVHFAAHYFFQCDAS